jgi:hypothetical protein
MVGDLRCHQEFDLSFSPYSEVGLVPFCPAKAHEHVPWDAPRRIARERVLDGWPRPLSRESPDRAPPCRLMASPTQNVSPTSSLHSRRSLPISSLFTSLTSVQLVFLPSVSSDLLLNPGPQLDRLIEANEALSEVFYLWYFPFCIDSKTLFP